MSFDPSGLAMWIGAGLVAWGLVSSWPPDAHNARVMLGCALVAAGCAAQYASHMSQTVGDRQHSPRYYHRPSVIWFFVSGAIAILFFLAFWTGRNPLARFIHPQL